MPSSTNLTGSNPGPNLSTLPDLTQSPFGAIREASVFTLTLSPASVANATSAEQTFTCTGLLPGDYVAVNKPTTQAGLGIVGSRVSAAGVLAITFGNFTAATITPTSSQSYVVFMARPLPATNEVPVAIG